MSFQEGKILVNSAKMSKKRIRKIRVFSLKQTNLLEATRNTRALVIIVAMKNIEWGVVRNTLLKLNKASSLGMFIIENYLTTLHCSSWVFDTECGFYICNCMHETKEK